MMIDRAAAGEMKEAAKGGATMDQFYLQLIDLERCQKSLLARTPITITGLTRDGKIKTFTGLIHSIQMEHTAFKDYPIMVAMVTGSTPTAANSD
jgi:hypothetical protein